MDKCIENNFKKDDWIVHSCHGVSHIEGIDKKSLDGKEKVYYKIKTRELTYWQPVKTMSEARIRAISSIPSLKIALSIIRKKPKILGSDYRERKNTIQESFKNASLSSRSELLRDLNGRVAQHRDNIYEENMLDTLKQQFTEEWAIANNCGIKQAKIILEEALKDSESKLEPV